MSESVRGRLLVAAPSLYDPNFFRSVVLVLEQGRPRLNDELLGAAARLAVEVDGRVVALGVEPGDDDTLGAAGAEGSTPGRGY